MQLCYFTIITKNYTSYAKTLGDSILVHHPDCKFFVIMVDNYYDELFQKCNHINVISVFDLKITCLNELILRYSILELCTSIKPFAFEWLFNNTNFTKAVYLDPDIYLISPLDDISVLLDKNNYDVLLTPHILNPLPDSHSINELTFLKNGLFNLGFIAFNNSNNSKIILSWWADNLKNYCYVDLENGLFTDQKWVDLIPILFDKIKIIKSYGYNVAYWNLQERNIKKLNDKWYSNNDLLLFIHFSGIKPLDSEIFSIHQNRFTKKNIGDLRILYDDYITKILNNDYINMYKLNCEIYDTNFLKDKYIKNYIKYNNINKLDNFDINFFEQFEDKIPNKNIVTKYMYSIYISRKDLQISYDLKYENQQLKFLSWFINDFEDISELSKYYLSKIINKNKIKNINIIKIISKNILNISIFIINLLISINPKYFRKIYNAYYKKYSFFNKVNEKIHTANNSIRFPFVKSRVLNFLNLFKKSKVQNGITLYGYLNGEFGVAENLRILCNVLEYSKINFEIINLSPGNIYKSNPSKYDNKISKKGKYNIEIFCVNADQVTNVFNNLNLYKNNNKRYRIGYWFWELAKFPAEWDHAISLMDELWAPSTFIKNSLLTASHNKLISIVPLSINFNIKNIYTRDYFNLPENSFIFLFSFDLNSFSSRKNPTGVIASFLEEFREYEMVNLVIKISYGSRENDEYLNLAKIAKNNPRIIIINEVLNRDEMYGLISLCDCYISLHRSEGFGLGMAESMYLGKPVIATAYSGNLDFMNNDNSCLVEYKLVKVNAGEYPHFLDQIWAEPTKSVAMFFMRKIYENKEYRNYISEMANFSIRSTNSVDSVSSIIFDRFKSIDFSK
jgi:hypothetical protein